MLGILAFSTLLLRALIDLNGAYLLFTWLGLALLYFFTSYWLFSPQIGKRFGVVRVLTGLGFFGCLLGWMPDVFGWPDVLPLYGTGVTLVALAISYWWIIEIQLKRQGQSNGFNARPLMLKVVFIVAIISFLSIGPRSIIYPLFLTRHELAARAARMMYTGNGTEARLLLEANFSKFSAGDPVPLFEPEISNTCHFLSSNLHGEILLELGDTNAAIQAFRHSLSTNPNDLSAGVNLALLANRKQLCNIKRLNGDYSYRSFELNDGFESATPESMGISTKALRAFEEGEDTPQLVSLIVLKDDKIIGEQYYHYSPLHAQWTYSVWKSIVSTMVGVAFDKGYITNPQQNISEFFRGSGHSFSGAQKQINLHEVLTMTSGIHGADIGPYWTAKDPLKDILDEPVVCNPGDRFYYSTMNMFLAMSIVSRTSNLDFSSFCEKHFWPMRVLNGYYSRNGIGSSIKKMPWDGSFLTLRDMAAFGSLFANEGRFRGLQLVSKEWMRKATTGYIRLDPDQNEGYTGYGYFFWLRQVNGHKVIVSRGRGGQMIVCVPESNIVVACFGSEWDLSGGGSIERLVWRLVGDLMVENDL